MSVSYSKPLPMKFIAQYIFKVAFILLAIVACMNIFHVLSFSNGISFLPSPLTVAEISALAIFLSGIQWLFFSGIVIKRMILILRCVLAIVCSIPIISVFGSVFNWFDFSLYLLTVLVPVFSVSMFIGAYVIAWSHENKIHSVKQIIEAVFHQMKKTAAVCLTALIIGMSTGYRGESELGKPWQDNSIVASELDKRDAKYDGGNEYDDLEQ